MQGQVPSPNYRPTTTTPLVPFTITTASRTTDIPPHKSTATIDYQEQTPKSPIIVVDDMDDDDDRATKRRRLDVEGGISR